jgi:hypothetical protein
MGEAKMTEPDNRTGIRSIFIVGLAAMTFTVTLAMVVGHRLRGQALAVLVGMVGGMGATVLTSLLVTAVGRRYDERDDYQPVVEVSGVLSEDGDPTGPLPLSQIPSPTGDQAALAEDGYRRGYRDGWIQGVGTLSDLMADRQLPWEAAYDICWHHWQTALLPWLVSDCGRMALPLVEGGEDPSSGYLPKLARSLSKEMIDYR